MRTWRNIRPITIVSAIAIVMTWLWLLLASARPNDEPIAPDARSPLTPELVDLLLFMQEEASVPYEPSEP